MKIFFFYGKVYEDLVQFYVVESIYNFFVVFDCYVEVFLFFKFVDFDFFSGWRYFGGQVSFCGFKYLVVFKVFKFFNYNCYLKIEVVEVFVDIIRDEVMYFGWYVVLDYCLSQYCGCCY